MRLPERASRLASFSMISRRLKFALLQVGDAAAGNNEQVSVGGLSRRLLAYCFCQVGDAAAAAKSRSKKVSVGEQTIIFIVAGWQASGVHAGAESKRVSKGGQAGQAEAVPALLLICNFQVGGAGGAHAKDNEVRKEGSLSQLRQFANQCRMRTRSKRFSTMKTKRRTHVTATL